MPGLFEARRETLELRRRSVEALDLHERVLAVSRSRDAITEGRLRGIQLMRELLQEPSWKWLLVSALEVALALRVSPEYVGELRRKNEIIGIRFGGDEPLYPAWQFTEEGVLGGMKEVLAALPPLGNDLTKAQFFVTATYSLPGVQSPIAYLLAGGDIQEVVALAESFNTKGGVAW